MKAFRLTAWPPPPSKRRLSGKKANAFGRNFQKSIMWSVGIHKSTVALEELPSMGAQRLGGNKIIPTKICIDFIGSFVNGSALFFDAKSVGESEVSFNVATWIKDRPHQIVFLRKMARVNAISGLMVECKNRGEYLWLPISQVTDDMPIRFARDGVLCRQWLSLGPITGTVDFKKLYEVFGQ